MEIIRRSVNEVDKNKCEKKDIHDVKQILNELMESKVEKTEF